MNFELFQVIPYVKNKFVIINFAFYRFLLISLVCFITLPLFADTLILKNKKVYRGKVVSQSEKSITFKTKEGQDLTFLKREVLKVVYKDLNEQEAKKVIQEEEKKIQTKTTLEESQETKPEEVTPMPTEEPKPDLYSDKRHWFSIFWRSALVPGWGQLKAERYYSAGFAFLAFVGTAGSAISSINNLSSAESNYKNLTALTPAMTSAAAPPDDPSASLLIGTIYNQSIFSSYQSTINKANNSVTVLAVVYGLQLVHAIYVGRQWEQEELPTTTQIFKEWNFDFHLNNQNFLGRDAYLKIDYTFRF